MGCTLHAQEGDSTLYSRSLFFSSVAGVRVGEKQEAQFQKREKKKKRKDGYIGE